MTAAATLSAVLPWDRPYLCVDCGERFGPDAHMWRCRRCHGLLTLEPADVELAPSEIARRPPSLWRWTEALPFPPGAPEPARLTMGEGAPPVVEVEVVGRTMAATVEFASPTLSFKDRGAVVLVAKALALGAHDLVADSSGNAGSAVAAYAARARLPCRIYVSARAAPAKIAQMAAHGALVCPVAGTRADVAAAAVDDVERSGAFYASHVYNPFFVEGTKTWAYDVWHHLGRRAPDVVVVPAGNGTLVLGAWRGFDELKRAGLVEGLPRIVAVQADACAPLAAAFAGARPVTFRSTVAEGIAIAAPARAPEILAAVRASGGTFLTVDDDAIVAAQRDLAGQGLFVEPTAAAVAAGAAAAGVGPTEVVALPLCGAGLKGPLP